MYLKKVEIRGKAKQIYCTKFLGPRKGEFPGRFIHVFMYLFIYFLFPSI